MANSQWVVDVSAETFQDLVIAQSQVRPVVVDFWAPWCGPCRALGPKLEALAEERNGGFLLAKVNTDESPQLAGEFQVDGIPAVFAIRNGKVVDQFTGVIPTDQLREFIDRLIPSEDDRKAQVALELEGRDPRGAEKLYREILVSTPDNPAAHVGLARLLLAVPGSESEAQKHLTGRSFEDYTTEASRLKTILQLREAPHSDSELVAATQSIAAHAGDAETHYSLGVVLAGRDDYVGALNSLLRAAELDRGFARGKVRELMLKIFDVIGPRSPQADHYRKQLQLLLY